MAVDSASLLLLKLLAVAALAMAMDRLPGHASASLRTTEQRTPCRSTMADHIRLGLNKPPWASGNLTTAASCACTFFAMPSGMLQPSSPASAGIESSKPAAMAVRFFVKADAYIISLPFMSAQKPAHP